MLLTQYNTYPSTSTPDSSSPFIASSLDSQPSFFDHHSFILHQTQTQHRLLIEAVIETIEHFFGSPQTFLSGLTDPRQEGKLYYPIESILFTAILMFLCRLEARRLIAYKFRNGPAEANFSTLFGVETAPHGDTINDLFCLLSPAELQELVCRLVETLIRKKLLYPYRLLDRYFVVAIDGTQIITFGSRHCEHCLTRTRNGKTIYYHNVLEAKLVCENGFSFSIWTEFIENPGPNPTKQDCELKAFYRLAERLKERFPRLEIVLTMDGLFACGPVMEVCKKNGWHYFLVLKDDSLKSVNSEFRSLVELEPANRLEWKTGKKLEIHQSYQWVEEIRYLDSQNREHYINVLECIERKEEGGEEKVRKFKWITDLSMTKKKVVELAQKGGRIRWKIENEGFNEQKNGGYGLEHAYSKNETAQKVYYYLMQIGHLISQLIEKGSLLKRLVKEKQIEAIASGRDLGARILEGWRNTIIRRIEIERIRKRKIQIRFDTS